jgi:DNA-directed RNA polymerase subunit K/omega
MIELPEGFDSVFRYITVVSQRAEQLINGAKVRSESRHKKRTLQAKHDVDSGTVDWRILTQEELDAQRQAIVEQFRAEVGADEYQGAPIPPGVMEAAAAAEAAADDDQPMVREAEEDDELARLQRLLGLTVADSEKPSDEEVENADAGDDESLDVADEDEALDVAEEESFEQLDEATLEGYDDSDDKDEDE